VGILTWTFTLDCAWTRESIEPGKDGPGGFTVFDASVELLLDEGRK
jgi:hypothetical protein